MTLRVLTLTGSVFDGKRQLLESLRTKFPGGTINIESHVSNALVGTYWQSLLQDYRNIFQQESEARVAFTTTHLGHQNIPSSTNYWCLEPQVIIARLVILLCHYFRRIYFFCFTDRYSLLILCRIQ